MGLENGFYNSGQDGITQATIIGIILFSIIILALLAYPVTAWLLSRVFKKAGQPAWAAWVPVYNIWKLLEIGGQQGFWAILILIPYANIVSLVFVFMAMHRVGKNLGKEDWFVILAILMPVIWMIWLGFDDSKWQQRQNPVDGDDTRQGNIPARTK